MTKKIDLHMHTNISDGDYSPFEIIDIAKKNNTDIISITDHDTVMAYKKYDLFSYAKKNNIKLIPGIEISTVDTDKKGYHIVGLFIDINSDILTEAIEKMKKNRIDYVKKSHKLFKENGYTFNLEEILKEETITKAHIADYILKNKLNKKKLFEEFGNAQNRGVIIEKYMLANQKCFVLQNNFTPKEAIDIIKKSNGLSFLAHPGFNILRGENLDLIFDKFSSYGVCGFEAFNIQFDKKNNNNQLNFSSEIEKKCLENNFLISGGSDFHTNIFSKRPHVKIGDDKICVPEKYFSEIEKNHKKNNLETI